MTHGTLFQIHGLCYEDVIMAIILPLVSVIMPLYKNDDYLAESVGSILKQTLRNFELIIICDDPSEKTREIIEDFRNVDDRIYVVYHERIGLIESLNEGIALARGTYIARMDADDISYPDRLEKQVAFLEAHSECSLVATHIEWIDECENVIGHWKADLRANTAENIRKILPRESCIAHPSVLFRQSVVSKYRYDPHQGNVEDYDLWLRMASDNLVLCKVPEVLLKLRIHNTSITASRRKISPGSDKIKCKLKYLIEQIMIGRISYFNLIVLFFLAMNCGIWLIRYFRFKLLPTTS